MYIILIFRYGRVQSVKLGSDGSAAVAFMDIKSAAKAHNAEHTLEDHKLTTEYYEPSAYSPSSALPTAPAHSSRFPVRWARNHLFIYVI